MVAYKKPQHRKKEEREQLRGERDKIKFIDLRVERWPYIHGHTYSQSHILVVK